MLNPAIESPGEWFSCLNVGDYYEDEDDRRKDKELVIPGFSIVEIVGIRKINDDHFVHEIRLNRQRTNSGYEVDSSTVGSSSNQAFTGPGDLLINHKGRIKFSPAMCRFTGNESDTDKIYGRYKAPERNSGKYTPAEYDEFEYQERIFGAGVRAQLLGSPDGSLKLPSTEDDSDQQFISGWDVLGVYKYNTGEKTNGKKDDDDKTKNLLVMVSPAVSAPPASVVFLTKEAITNQAFETGSVAVDLLEYVNPRSANWNHKFLLEFSGVFGHEFAFEIRDGSGTFVGPFLISSDGTDIQAALESLSWVGKGNVTVRTPGQRTGRFIIEFIGDLAGIRVNGLYWQRIIEIGTPPANLLGGVPEVPPITLVEIVEYDYRIKPGTHRVQITPASRPMSHYQRWYGTGYGGYGYGYNYAYGYYGGGDYGYYGGWGGGPLGYYGGNYYNGYGYFDQYNNGYYGPNGYNSGFFAGPFEYDMDGNHIGPQPNVLDSQGNRIPNTNAYNSSGYNEAGFDKDGYDPAGFNSNGLNADGDTWAYYGVWGHLHSGNASHDLDHQNDHGIVNNRVGNVFQHTAAGSFGIANWVDGGGYVVTELEQREFWMDVTEGNVSRVTTY
ncbi:hypothetical protein [uncultured Gimesia sp.]|mgnify:CR=1 FL=1|uniref:hypothetical protein n=1 Tax=uncultured Gimesia sp. TaxID=1678688 RepID=UPI0030D8FBB0|tara:strand:+ start:105358 stop:107184 length:1827 start_codon:yes stop_codon:yes gene_type:complete